MFINDINRLSYIKTKSSAFKIYRKDKDNLYYLEHSTK